mmetsp:Transcript_35184/g.71229  ORF Transcript_35184/g.71229 Transcript_35184/m.71229 type:complete len:461 (-) Transcript_35184:3381-4763(-)
MLHHVCQCSYMQNATPSFEIPFGKAEKKLCPQHCRQYCNVPSAPILTSPQATAAAIATGSAERLGSIASPASWASPGLESVASDFAEDSLDGDEELTYPLSVERSYLKAFFKDKDIMNETVWNPIFSDPPPIDFNWDDKAQICNTFKPRHPRKKYGQRQIPQALIQDVVDPQCEEATQANRLVVVNLWRCLSPSQQKEFFAYLRENIFARPSVNNDPLPASDYAEEVARRSDNGSTSSVRPLAMASAADTDAALENLVKRSHSSKHTKKRRDRKIGEPVRTNAQILDKTTRKQIRKLEAAAFNVYKTTTIAEGAVVSTLYNSVTVNKTNAQDPRIGGGRHRTGEGEIGFEKRRGYHYVVTCRSRQEAEDTIGAEKLREYSEFPNTCEFNVYEVKSPARRGVYRMQKEGRKRPGPKGLSTTKKNAKKARLRAESDSDDDYDENDFDNRALFHEDDEDLNDF